MSLYTLPGLVDIHVHLRDPGQTSKEDFFTGTQAALAGGFTTVFDMPNNALPITTKERLDEKIEEAKKKTVANIGFYFGSLGDNLDEFSKIGEMVFGLKLYLNMTTGGFVITPEIMEKIYLAWHSTKPVLLHSEEDIVEMVVNVIRKTGQVSHFCHVSSAHELTQIIKAKEEGLPVTCGVCPHHLFFVQEDVKTLGSYGQMKPPLKTKKDREFLWQNLRYIDVIESDHAPHTKEEKNFDHPPHGVPGLETTLPLLLTAYHQGRITLADIIRLCYEGPMKVLHLSDEEGTKIEVDIDSEYAITSAMLKTKCGWSPFEGWNVKGRVKRVFVRNQKVFEDGTLCIKPGEGKVLDPEQKFL